MVAAGIAATFAGLSKVPTVKCIFSFLSLFFFVILWVSALKLPQAEHLTPPIQIGCKGKVGWWKRIC